MIDENGKEVSEEALIREAIDHLADSLGFLYETTSDNGRSLCFMVDNCVKYGQVILRGDSILDAAADYTTYEERVSSRKEK